MKILLIGPDNTDKTRLMLDIVTSYFKTDYKNTIGVDVYTKRIISNKNNEITLSIWDIGNQKRFDSIKSTFYKGAKGSIYVFDTSSEASWNQIKDWIQSTEQYTGIIPFLLFGKSLNSEELKGENIVQTIDEKEYNNFANQLGGFFIRIEEANKFLIEEAIELLTNEMVDRIHDIETYFNALTDDISNYLSSEPIRSFLNKNSAMFTEIILQKKMEIMHYNKYIRGMLELLENYEKFEKNETDSKILHLSKITDKKIEYVIHDISDLLADQGLKDSIYRNYPKFVTYYTQFEKNMINCIDMLKIVFFEL